MPDKHLKKIAIVGSGSAGIAALWALNRTHHDVYLYEASDRLGGHINTVEWKQGRFRTLVDTGFVVFNSAASRSYCLTFHACVSIGRLTSPLLTANFKSFLDKLGLGTVPTCVTTSVSRDRGAFEWIGAGAGLRALFAQRANLLSPRMWRLLFDTVRFQQFALDLLRDDDHRKDRSLKGGRYDETIGQYLDREGYSDAFRDDYLLPLAAGLWSMSPEKCAFEFPVIMLVRYMWNHNLLEFFGGATKWSTLENGSRAYIDTVMKGFPPNHLFLKTAVKHISNTEDGQVNLHLENGRTDLYDHVILATHGDQAYQIVAPSATEEEKVILSKLKTQETICVLHSDTTLMPRRRRAWAALNHTTTSSRWSSTEIEKVSLTYDMNTLQRIPREAFGNALVTINPLHEPKAALVQGRYSYSNPVYDQITLRALELLPKIQNKRGISFAGAWTKYGFHEDGFTSGLHVAKNHLGAKLPFDLVDPTYVRGRYPRVGIVDSVIRIVLLLVQIFVIDLLERLARKYRTAKPVMNGRGRHKRGAKGPASPRLGPAKISKPRTMTLLMPPPIGPPDLGSGPRLSPIETDLSASSAPYGTELRAQELHPPGLLYSSETRPASYIGNLSPPNEPQRHRKQRTHRRTHEIRQRAMKLAASNAWRAAAAPSSMCTACRRQQQQRSSPTIISQLLARSLSTGTLATTTMTTAARRIQATTCRSISGTTTTPTTTTNSAATRLAAAVQRSPGKPGLGSSSRSASTAAAGGSSAGTGPEAAAAALAARARQHALQAESMARVREHYKLKNRTTMFYVISVILGTVAFSYGSVPMYKMICQTTGWGGQPIRAPGHGGGTGADVNDPLYDPAERLRPVTTASRIRVTFNASVSDSLPWKFTPQQREVRVLPGETALAFYTATNKSDKDIIGVATYSVTPGQTAPYFSKIQCFCFEEQRLNAGETVDMPVFFYLDPDLLNDMNMRGVNEVTLSYTFFKAKYDNNGSFTSIPESNP
ncbi:cytochrome c oxidase assembly protein CtaG/Cox11-domain-containing protein [Microdochium bolleyi]|uniref:Cytochrome c oxidase assembly protein CtaG/Cox11-domain-containing protein n=1 Tax=Microdochium bolleyi TaxID=196109 RepID=A0A136JJ05_9PEZI|nr:cytochrome c oxidase assembly protein CtaG/Cox11-domain-containing protein [Microdochium bolleyi]